MNMRRIAGVAAGCAVAVATALGVQSVEHGNEQSAGQGDARRAVVRSNEVHDEVGQVYQWWVKVEKEGPDVA